MNIRAVLQLLPSAAGLAQPLLSVALLLISGIGSASAQHLSFRYYSGPEGLTTAGVNCITQEPSGSIVACTEHGVYVYDGRRFINLGRTQGLPEGNLAYDVAFDPEGHVFIRYVDRVFVSRQPVSASQPMRSLSFQQAGSDLAAFYEAGINHMASWGDGVVLLVDGRLAKLDAGRPGTSVPRIRSLTLPGLAAIGDAKIKAIIRTDNTLWASLSDGRLCSFEQSGQCYGLADGLPNSRWTSVIKVADNKFYARSTTLLAAIEPSTRKATVETLPWQGGRYAYDPSVLQLVRSPSGTLMTQSARGMIVRDGTSWRPLNILSGVPAARLTGFLFDRQGNLWFSTMGKGIFRTLGYGVWDNWDISDGLSDNIVWQITRQPGGPLWVATESGLDAVGPTDTATVARRHLDGSGYTLANGANGDIWRAGGTSGAFRLEVATGTTEYFKMPALDYIVRGRGDRVWFATEKGMFYIDDTHDGPRRLVAVPSVTSRVQVAAADVDGGVWMIQDQRLTHLHADGTVAVIVKDWLGQQFEPADLSFHAPDEIWVGGAGGGLFRVNLADDRVTAMTQFQPPDLASTTVLSVLVDRRGWVWAGTDRGISVFNGQRWASFDVNSGLVWNDLNQGGLYEDTDGSIWIATSQGLSHLLDPASLFKPAPFDVTISSVRLGGQSFPGAPVSYTTDPLALEFGTSDFRSERSLTFRYKLDGVDKDWAEAPDARARYPFVPPGRHELVVVAVNSLTHEQSRPARYVLEIREPWWWTWPAVVAEGALGLLAVYGGWRLRYRRILRQQRILQRLVEQRTEEMRVAQAALLLQATQDSLTGLLTRGETEKRLAAMLARLDKRSRVIICLIDIDHFKRINDTHGHLGGDKVLEEIGARTLRALQPGEYAGRYGGEEVLMVLGDADGNGDARIAAFHEAVGGVPFILQGRPIRVTCSIGIAWARTQDDWESLIGRADDALYTAKREGRNRIVEAEERRIVSPKP